MFSAKQLTPDQVDQLKQLAATGASLSDLQRHLKDEHDISITFMDTRLLVLDLGIELVTEKPAEEPKPDEPDADATVEATVDATIDAADKPDPLGAVSVTMDNITLPGAMVSGKVTFSDGETAIWMIDQNGRPGLDPDTPGYRPSENDIMAFQTQLRSLLEQQQGGL